MNPRRETPVEADDFSWLDFMCLPHPFYGEPALSGVSL
jgi:hypothetical protein